MKKKYGKITNIIWFILVLLLLYIAVTSMIARFRNPELTETQKLYFEAYTKGLKTPF